MAAHGLSTQDLYYNVFLDGDKIGFHRVTIEPIASRKIVQVEASFNVKFLIFNAYQYQHTAKEEWNDSCLTKILTTTDDNGTKLFVNGQQQSDAFRIQSPDGSQLVKGCVKSFAYWDPQLIQATHLLNTQSGKYTPVKTVKLGEEDISLGQGRVNATHYRISSDQFVIDVWYSANKEWLALSTTTENGSNLRYEKR
jgi:hypothetical protein